MFGIWMSYWSAACAILVAIIVVASLSQTPTRRRYLTAASAFAILSLGTAASLAFPLFLNIEMANAFGPRSVSALAYLLPTVGILALTYPALSLFPFMSAEKGRKVLLAAVGLAVVWTLVSFVRTMIRWPQSQGNSTTGAIMACFYLLLWLRVYDLRRDSGQL